MAKREFVEKNDLKNTLLPVEGHMSAVDMIINRCNVLTEEDIVKPYLEQLKRKMKENDEDNGGEPLNMVDKGYHLACEHLYKEIDELFSNDVGGDEDTITIPREEVKQFILNIQKIKDDHNDEKIKAPINYGTICGILIEGYRLLEKYEKKEGGAKNE
jgi:hypothetical protein